MSTFRTIADVAWTWFLIAVLAFANYLWFFERNLLDASLISTNNPWHQQAMTLTYLTIGLCLLFNYLQRRDPAARFNRHVLWSIAGFFFIALNLIYNPWISPYFRVVPLELTDWAYALGAAGMFVLIREFQLIEKEHSRKAVLELHRKHPRHHWHPRLRTRR